MNLDLARQLASQLQDALKLNIVVARPLPPDIVADALQDRLTPASGRLLSASPVIRKP
jgi:hypothetical protein